MGGDSAVLPATTTTISPVASCTLSVGWTLLPVIELERSAPQSRGSKGQAQVAAIQGAGDVQVTGNASINVVGGDSHNHTHVHYHGTAKDLRTVLDAIANYRKIQQDMLAKATPGTVIWLFDGPEFRIFIDVDGDLKIMWGFGIPGAGKTILASIVIDKLEALARKWNYEICVAFIYIRYSDQGRLTLRNILEVLVKQTVERHPDCFELAQQIYDRHVQEGTQPTEGELLQLLRQFAGMKRATFYVLDALDEAPDMIRLTLLKKLSSLGVRLFITSRPLPAIEAKFPTAHSFPILARDEDLDLHIAEKLEASEHLQDLLEQGGKDFRDCLITTVKAKCGGMFLHASLQLDALQQCFTVHDAMQTLEAFPRSIEDVYQQTWERIVRSEPRHASLAKTAFVWVLNAKRSITIDELRHALATSPNTHSFEPARLMPEAALVSACRGLITIDKESRLVRLVHYTAKEPLEQFLHTSFPHPHSLLADVCIIRLTDCGFRNTTITSARKLHEELRAEPLLDYAYYSWAFHVHKSINLDSTTSRSSTFIAGCRAFPAEFTRFIHSDKVDILGPFHMAHFYNFPIAFAGPHHAEETNTQTQLANTPLHLACMQGHCAAAQNLLCSPGILVNVKNGNGDTPLQIAYRNGDEDIVKLLLSRPDTEVNLIEILNTSSAFRRLAVEDAMLIMLLSHPNTKVNLVNNYGATALLIAASTESEPRTVNLLLAHPDINVNCANKSGVTPLIVASHDGNNMVVALLLAHPNTNVNLVDNDGNTALLHAVSRESNTRVVKTLLSHPDINVNLADKDGDTAVINACRVGYDSIVALLLAHPGTEVNIANSNGTTALLQAVSRESNASLRIVKTLLSRPDINVNLADKDGDTALINACRVGYKSIVTLLLAHPSIQVNIVDSKGHTALLLAASEESNASTVKLLLDHPDSDVNLTDEDGDTPLTNACREGFESIVALLVAAPGVHVNHTNRWGEAAINLAAQNGCEESVRILLEVPGINASAKSTDGQTPMSAAVARGYGGIVRLLQELSNNSAFHPGYEGTASEARALESVESQRSESVDSQVPDIYADALDFVAEEVSDEDLELYEDALESL